MAQHDYDIANQNGALFRADINNAFAADVSNNSGATEPATKFAYMFWVDTANAVLKMRDSTNSSWITIGPLEDYFGFFSAAGGTITGDTIFSSTGYLQLPGGTTAQRPVSPASGMVRMNSTNTQLETYIDGSWQPVALGQILSNPFQVDNYSLAASVGSSALTVSLKDQSGSNASSLSPIYIGFRSATASSGLAFRRSVTGSLSLVVPSGATLGHSNATAHYIYVYAIDNAGTVELAVSSTLVADNATVNTTALSAAADLGSGFYSTSARTGVAIRLIGRMLSTQTTAGTYASVPSEIYLMRQVSSALNSATSSSCGTFTTTSLSLVDVTNLSVDLVTSGGKVWAGLVPVYPGTASFTAFRGASTAAGGAISLLCDGAQLSYSEFGIAATGVTGTWTSTHPANHSIMHTPTAGKHTYKLQACSLSSTSVTTSVKDCALTAYEMREI